MSGNVRTYALCVAMLVLCFACTENNLIKGKSGLKEPVTANIKSVASRHEALLYTEGTRIMRSGKEIKIYGMDVDHHPLLKKSNKSNARSPYETLFTPEDMDFFKENGFNLVPLHNILLEEMTDGDGNINEAFFKNWIDVWVQWATQRKLYISIGMSSFHVHDMTWGVYTMPRWIADDYGGRPEGINWREQMRTIIHGFYGMDERSQDEREIYYQLWEYIAKRYKNNPYVLYAPTNEPLHHTFQNFEPGESYWHRLARAYTNTMTNVIDHIREGEAGGLEKLVFIDRAYFKGGTFVNYQLPIERDNIVWEFHEYGDAEDISKWGGLEWWKEQVQVGRDFFHKWNKPVHVGEWSPCPTVDPGFWDMNRVYRDKGGWRYIHEEQAKWLSKMNVSHSWFHYPHTSGEYWNVVMKKDGYRVLNQSDTDFIFNTLREYSR